MDARLRDLGGEMALVLDRQTWNAAGIDGEMEIEIISGNAGVQIRPKRGVDREEILASARKMAEIHDETFRKLAQ